jgi:hypothetical protein
MPHLFFFFLFSQQVKWGKIKVKKYIFKNKINKNSMLMLLHKVTFKEQGLSQNKHSPKVEP